MSPDLPLRILCIGETWFGSDARAAFAALRRAGHSIEVIDESHFVPTEWESFGARVIRKLFRSLMVDELTNRAARLVELFKPGVLFVFKGNYVAPDVIRNAKSSGVLTLNYYPDVSFMTHGPQLPVTLPLYDHVFNTKTFGVRDMSAHGVRSVSFLAPGFDPDIHKPVTLSASDIETFGADVSFIGTWSPKKESQLAALRKALPAIRLRVWGNQWNRRTTRELDDCVMGMGVHGEDYTRAICASKICLGLLSEARAGASSGDLITARTFQVPACGVFMLHERNAQVTEYFAEGIDAEFFASADELAAKVRKYLDDDDARLRVASSGLRRSLESDYSIDRRMREMVEWIRNARGEVTAQ